MCAGVPEMGAADGSYGLALQIEATAANKERVAGGAADIYKCLDQVQRPILDQVFKLAGLPQGGLDAYTRHQENVTVRTTSRGASGWSTSSKRAFRKAAHSR